MRRDARPAARRHPPPRQPRRGRAQDRGRAASRTLDGREGSLGEGARQWTHETDDWSLEVAKGVDRMHPRQMLRELEKAMPKGAMVSTDIGNICSVSNSYLRFSQPQLDVRRHELRQLRLCASRPSSAPRSARPTRPAIAYVGDGAWGMSFGEILTCVREDIPVTAVVFNNEQWGRRRRTRSTSTPTASMA